MGERERGGLLVQFDNNKFIVNVFYIYAVSSTAQYALHKMLDIKIIVHKNTYKNVKTSKINLMVN